jgi:hypothetical protein
MSGRQIWLYPLALGPHQTMWNTQNTLETGTAPVSNLTIAEVFRK